LRKPAEGLQQVCSKSKTTSGSSGATQGCTPCTFSEHGRIWSLRPRGSVTM